MTTQNKSNWLVSPKLRQEVKKFGETIHAKTLYDLEVCYQLAFCMMYFNHEGMKTWHQYSNEGVLFTSPLMNKAIEQTSRPNLKKDIKDWSRHIRQITLSEYVSKRMLYNDWEQEIETEQQTEDIEVSSGRNEDIYKVIDDMNTIRETIKRLDEEKKFNQIWLRGDYFYIKFRYSPNIVTAIKSTFENREWHKDELYWTVGSYQIKEIREFALQYNFTFHDNATKHIYGDQEAIKESYETSADFHIDGFKIEPYPYQKAGIFFGHKRKKVLVADEMGLGKSCQAMGIVMSHNAFPCIVVAPKSLLYNWKNEWMKFTGKEAVVMHNSKHDINYILRLCNVVITNYEGVKKLLPYKDRFNSLIVDESHYCKSDKTQRYKQIFELGINKDVKVLLTGTPIMNRPSELIPQLKILDLLKTKPIEQKFRSRYCKVLYGKEVGANLEELNIKLRSMVMIRREKADVLQDLPDLTRNYIDVELSNIQEYENAEKNFIEYLREVKKMSDRKIKAAMNAEILVKMGVLKEISARGKMEAIKSFCETCFEEEQKIILFAHHRAILSDYVRELNSNLLITGATEIEERQKIVDRFQNNKEEKSICLSIRAASVGLTLTAASVEIFAEFDWNPAMHDQAEARAHRIGQKDHVNAYYFKGTGTIDEDIISLIESKRSMINQATGTTNTIEQNNTIIKDLLKKRYDFDMQDEPLEQG